MESYVLLISKIMISLQKLTQNLQDLPKSQQETFVSGLLYLRKIESKTSPLLIDEILQKKLIVTHI